MKAFETCTQEIKVQNQDMTGLAIEKPCRSNFDNVDEAALAALHHSERCAAGIRFSNQRTSSGSPNEKPSFFILLVILQNKYKT